MTLNTFVSISLISKFELIKVQSLIEKVSKIANRLVYIITNKNSKNEVKKL